MPLFHIIVLSIVQGLTEFLPVSSSGHLVLVPLVIQLPDQGLLMDLAVHIGTLLAVLVYYRRDLWAMALGFLRHKTEADAQARRLGIYILLASLPAVIIGFLLHKLVPEGIRDVRVIAFTTIFFGLLMGIADMRSPRDRALGQMTLKSALVIGAAQVLALIPGTSRSGVTMTAARLLGYQRVEAARFSFLLSMPAVAGAGLLAALDLADATAAMQRDAVIAGAMTFVAAFATMAFLMQFLRKASMLVFVVYRVALGAALLAFF
jgi:undecaprenyl-diphosphatase